MRMKWGMAAAVVALVGTGVSAKADLTLDGQTGLFLNPTAEIVQRDAPEIQLGYQRTKFFDESADMYGVGLAGQVASGLELSANFNRGNFLGGHANNWRIGGKYQILNQDKSGFDLAIGGSYEDYGIPAPLDLTHYGVYAAITKSFTSSDKATETPLWGKQHNNHNNNKAPIKATAGVRWDKLSLNLNPLINYKWRDSKVSFYGGAEVPLIRDGQLKLVGEVNSKIFRDGKTLFALGLRYHPKDTGFIISGGLGRTNAFEMIQGTDTGFFLQLGYQFGK